jgi:hypothetical protein
LINHCHPPATFVVKGGASDKAAQCMLAFLSIIIRLRVSKQFLCYLALKIAAGLEAQERDTGKAVIVTL